MSENSLFENSRKQQLVAPVFFEKSVEATKDNVPLVNPVEVPEVIQENKQEPIEVVWQRVQENMPANLKKRREIEDYKRNFLRADYNSMTEEEKQALRDKKTYTIKKLSVDQIQENRNNVKKLKLGSISDAIMEVCPEAYHEMYDYLMDDNQEEKEVELVHSLGDQLLKQGHDVLEIDVGGSSFHQFRREYNGYHGKSTEFEGEENEQYGHRLHEGNNFEWVKERELNGRKKTRYTMAGPLKADGKLNGGDYSIEKDRKRIMDFGVAYLEPIFKGWLEQIDNKQTPDFHDIDLLIRGHSRGGVAVSHGSMMIKAWIAENYPMFDVFVHFRTLQIDPVPGGDVETASNVNGKLFERFDISEYGGVNDGIFEIDGQKMKALSDDADTTVIYSIANQDDFVHNNLFNPQEVLHGKRVILIPTDHDSGLDLAHIDTTQMGEKGREKAHGMAYYDAHSGKVYRNSGITQMDEGVYIMDENQILIKIETEAQLKSIMDKILKKGHQEKRQKRLMSACASVLGDKSAVDDYLAIDHIRTQKLMAEISSSGKSLFASDVRSDLANSIDSLRAALKVDFYVKGSVDSALNAYDDTIEKCNKYIRKRDSSKWTDRGVKRLMQIKSLHRALSKERAYLVFLGNKTRNDFFEINSSSGSIESLFSQKAVIDRADVTGVSDGVYRVEKGDNVTFFEKKDKQTAKKMAFCSLAAETMGETGIYQGVTIASMKDGDTVSEGIVKENVGGIRMESLTGEERQHMVMSQNARKQLASLKLMDVIFGVNVRMEDPYKDLYADIKRDKKDGHIIVNSFMAQCPATKILNDDFSLFINEEEKNYMLNLGESEKRMIRSINPLEILRSLSILKIGDEYSSKLEARLEYIKQLVE